MESKLDFSKLRGERKSGILLHLSSLNSDYGIGDLGKGAIDFLDFLNESNQSVWSILPIHPTGFGNSPYSPISTFAGNPLFIDIDELLSATLIEKFEVVDLKNIRTPVVNYGEIIPKKMKLLRLAASRFINNGGTKLEDFNKFILENEYWLEDYSLFSALKEHFSNKFNTKGRWFDIWPKDILTRERKSLLEWQDKLFSSIQVERVVQYFFFRDLSKILKKAKSLDIEIFGDVPFFVAEDSVETWTMPELFYLDSDFRPTHYAGVPSDGPDKPGQQWGLPVYNNCRNPEKLLRWWIQRIEFLSCFYNIIRLDHFKGFDSIFSIPRGHEINEGEWIESNGEKIFTELSMMKCKHDFFAEDLGFMTQRAFDIMTRFNIGSTRIIQFGFNQRNNNKSIHLPFYFDKNVCVFPGNHDMPTIGEWFKKLSISTKSLVRKITKKSLLISATDAIIDFSFSSTARLCIIQMQDLLREGKLGQMNKPGLSKDNWVWRLPQKWRTQHLEQKLRQLSFNSGRNFQSRTPKN